MTVHLWDANTNGTDYELVQSTTTDDGGGFQFQALRNWEYWDDGDPDHRLDLYIKIEAIYNNSAASVQKVTNTSGGTYTWRRGTHNNVPDWTIDLSYDVGLNDSTSPAMWIFRDLRRAWEYVNGQAGADAGSVTAAWQDNVNCYLVDHWVCNSFFYAGAGGPFIFVTDLETISSDIAIHETGHHYMYNVNQWWWWLPSCWNHQMFNSIDTNCAWSEGWADFFALPVNGDACFDFGPGPCGAGGTGFDNLETQNRNDGRAQGDSVEGRVAGSLYDLYDGVNDGFDQAIFGFPATWNAMRSRPVPTTFNLFWNRWLANGHNQTQSLWALYQNTIDYGVPLNRTYLPLISK